MKTKTHFKVKNKVTGYTYTLIKDDVDRLIVEEPHNFEVIDKDYIKPVTETIDKTVYSQIIEDETDNKETTEKIIDGNEN